MKIIFSLIIVLFPILSVYESFIPMVSMADFLLIVTFPIITVHLLVNKLKIDKILLPIIVFAYYIFITMFIQIGLDYGVGILSTIRYLLYLVFLVYAIKYFDFQFAIKALRITTIGLSFYVFLQFLVFFFFSFTLPWRISLFNVMDYNFVLKEQTEFYLNFYRPTGLFMEPTHFAQYCAVYLIYLLFKNAITKVELIQALLITTAILVSGSSLGLLLIAFVWVIWFIRSQRARFSPLAIILVLAFTMALVLLFNIEYFNNIVSRVFTSSGFNGTAVGYRFNSLSLFKEQDLSIVQWIIGSGRSTEDAYFTGIFYFLNANGIAGLALYLWLCMSIVLKNRGFIRWFVVSILLLSIGSEFVSNFGILFYFSFVYGFKKYEECTRITPREEQKVTSDLSIITQS